MLFQGRAFVRRTTVIVALLLFLVAPSLFAHDLFLKFTTYFLAPAQRVTVTVLNGSFTTSENTITRDRLRDISLVAARTRQRLDTSAWTASPDRKSSRLTFEVGAPGTYVIGASTKPLELAMEAKAFNDYLAEDGLTSVLEARKSAGEMNNKARERYSKHVKAIFQVGDVQTGDFAATFGYPAEIVPVANPYAQAVGSELAVKCLLSGFPAGGVEVLAGGTTKTGQPIPQQKTTSGADGVARVKLTSAGSWYVKFIKMERRTGDKVDYQSTWATLTFGVR
jgi:uncharacterized GH25 family protein